MTISNSKTRMENCVMNYKGRRSGRGIFKDPGIWWYGVTPCRWANRLSVPWRFEGRSCLLLERLRRDQRHIPENLNPQQISPQISHPGIFLEELRETTKNVMLVDVSAENSHILVVFVWRNSGRQRNTSGYSMCQPGTLTSWHLSVGAEVNHEKTSWLVDVSAKNSHILAFV